jgi:ADP-heptose:LPS heptosyltransferase
MGAVQDVGMDLTLQKTLFSLSSSLTDHFPRAGARVLDAALVPLVANPWLASWYGRRNRAVLDRLAEVRKVLVLADIHLGDAVLLQGLVLAVRDFFPEAWIDYVVSRAAQPFLEGHPDVSRLWPLYTGSPLPSAEDMAAVGGLVAAGGYDLVVNACPSFVPGRPLPERGAVLDFLTHAPHLVRNEYAPAEPNHFLFQSHRFLAELFQQRWSPQRPSGVTGAWIHLDDAAVDLADAFADSARAFRNEPWVLLNPDGASPYTRPPEAFLAPLLRRLADGGAFVLVGEGHTDAGVGIRLQEALPPALRARTLRVPAVLPAPAYAALLDRVDVFVSGDTGPLHWGAARKVSRTGRRAFWNHTTVVSLFGATPARMSGYDSVQPGFLPAWQDAPSAVFQSHPPCRNLTCLNKPHKTCRVPRCFEGCSPLAIADAVLERLGAIQAGGAAHPGRFVA